VDVIGPVAQERQFRRTGIAEYFPDSKAAQQVEGCLLDGKGCGGAFRKFAGHLDFSRAISRETSSPLPWGEVGAKRRVRGQVLSVDHNPSPYPSPKGRGKRLPITRLG